MTRRAHHLVRAALCALALCLAHDAARAQDDHREPPAPTPPSADATATGPIGRSIAAASDHAVLRIPAGVHHERLRIDRPITLEAEPGAILDGGGSGDIIEILAPDVTIRGLTLRNTGIDLDRENVAIRVNAARCTIESCVLQDVLFGIDLREAPDSIIRGNTIGGKDLDIARRGDGLRLWRSDRTLVEGNTLHDGRDAILWYSKGVVVRGNASHDCRYGLHLMFSDEVTIEGNTLAGNSVGVYLMYSTDVTIRMNRLMSNRGPSGYGIGLKETDRYEVRDNIITGNRVGVYIDGSPLTGATPGVFERNTIAFNDIGMTFLPSARNNQMTRNNFIDNIDQVSVAGRGTLDANKFWKDDTGNYWSDYTGYDEDRDGVGDFVHESQTLFESMMDRDPALRLFLFSPAQQAIEFVGRAIPAIRPEPKFTDEVPLMRPVPIGLVNQPTHSALASLAATGAGMIALAAAIAGLARPFVSDAHSHVPARVDAPQESRP
ncbi:MAG: nitrous oxide reductase family maturation protein NosD [Phycisphaerales bacterium]|jgi:nitrous oxidase accessory protein|nr:nitrous oxide reductase family maturation protein NosD [Phycisphaerales bacterium]